MIEGRKGGWAKRGFLNLYGRPSVLLGYLFGSRGRVLSGGTLREEQSAAGFMQVAEDQQINSLMALACLVTAVRDWLYS